MSAESRNYGRNKQVQSPPTAEQSNQAPKSEEPIQVNGFAQVLAMLQVADPEFRESLLRRLAQRDPHLALSLRKDLKNQGL